MNQTIANYLHVTELAKLDPLMITYTIGLYRGLSDEEKELVQLERVKKKISGWANHILAAAQYDASSTGKNSSDWRVRNILDEIQLHYNGYAEPGYTNPNCGIIATGNWNEISDWRDDQHWTISNVPVRIGRLFNKLGIETEWSDEWSECSNCGKLVRTEPDSMSWKPAYIIDENGLWCHKCDEPENGG